MVRPLGRRAALALLVRLGAGGLFVVFGVGKFVNHASEVASFRAYDLPWPDAFTYAIGVIEIIGGGLLLCGLGTRLAALVLAGDMIGAVIASGIGQGELLSLTLAPALLVGMLFLLWVGPGIWALDHGLAAMVRERGSANQNRARRQRHRANDCLRRF